MSGELVPDIDIKTNLTPLKELHQSFEDSKQQLQHEIETRDMLLKVLFRLCYIKKGYIL